MKFIMCILITTISVGIGCDRTTEMSEVPRLVITVESPNINKKISVVVAMADAAEGLRKIREAIAESMSANTKMKGIIAVVRAQSGPFVWSSESGHGLDRLEHEVRAIYVSKRELECTPDNNWRWRTDSTLTYTKEGPFSTLEDAIIAFYLEEFGKYLEHQLESGLLQ